METQLCGQVVVVTGGSGGIGSAICRRFAAEGARLVVHYRSGRQQAAALRRELKETETISLQADLRRETDARRLFTAAIERFGRVDSVVVNAGAWETQYVPLHIMTLRQWRQTLAGVLDTAFLTTREFLRVVAKQKRGNAVIISSTAAVFGEAGHADYASAKAAIGYGLLRSLKNEMSRLAPHTKDYCGGRINCISPGWTVVPRVAASLRHAQKLREITSTMSLPQLALPEDIANAAVFLSSDALARHITGENLVIAGGMEGRRVWKEAEIDTSLI